MLQIAKVHGKRASGILPARHRQRNGKTFLVAALRPQQRGQHRPRATLAARHHHKATRAKQEYRRITGGKGAFAGQRRTGLPIYKPPTAQQHDVGFKASAHRISDHHRRVRIADGKVTVITALVHHRIPKAFLVFVAPRLLPARAAVRGFVAAAQLARPGGHDLRILFIPGPDGAKIQLRRLRRHSAGLPVRAAVRCAQHRSLAAARPRHPLAYGMDATQAGRAFRLLHLPLRGATDGR